MNNTVQKFLLQDLDVRGVMVHIDDAWKTLLDRRAYPADMTSLLGQASVATLLMGSHIKFNGQLSLQLQSPSDLSLMVVQTDNKHHFRALAQYQQDTQHSYVNLSEVAAKGLIAIMVEAEKGKDPYQGVVGIESDALSDNLENYFNQSEQLQTMLVLRADENSAAGLLLQVMPGSKVDADDWNRLRHVAETLNLKECAETDCETMISRIFAEDDKTAYEPEEVTFACTCSDERTLSMLASLDNEELQDILDEGETMTISCDFCGKNYDHDSATIAALLANKIHPN